MKLDGGLQFERNIIGRNTQAAEREAIGIGGGGARSYTNTR